ncbi:MAG: hypothetical protein ABSH51_20465 [Solirubrobacteraceae bacterium]
MYATGDAGSPTASQGVFYPAALDGVTAAGGTNLMSSLSQDGPSGNPTQISPLARGFQESAWAWNGSTGGGSGCNTQTGITKPSYQTDTAPGDCAGRSYADVSADADPTTGIDVYSTVDGGWVVYGGTSLATPLTSAALAATGANDGSADPGWAYTDAAEGLLNDPTGGSTATGACDSAPYICTAGTGYDGPTGAGSISGAVVTGAPGIGGAPVGWGQWNSSNTYATTIGQSTATLVGGVYPNGLDTAYSWQYGPTTGYGQQTAATDIGSGTAAVMTTTTLTGLTAGATYHYRLVATNSAGTTYGYDYTLQTLSAPPTNTTPPSISGQAQQGQTLTATAGTWSGAVSTYAYQWQSSADNGQSFTNIAGATTASYIPVAGDVGDTLRVSVTAGNQADTTTVSSAAVGPVSSGAPSDPTPPTIAGSPRQGLVLTESSTWTPATAALTYQWQRSGDGSTWTPIAGAQSAGYTVQRADESDMLRVIVTASTGFGQLSATSPAVGPAAANPPLNTVAPVMTGTAQRADALTVTQGTWSGAGNVYSYQWQRSADGQTWSAISGATGTTWTLGQDDEGEYVRVVVSASNPDGVVSAASNPTATIVSPHPPANTTPPVISGAATRTSTLTATTGTWTGRGLTYAFQWQHDAGDGYQNIPGATGSTYTLQASDENTYVRVVVAATNLDATIVEASQPTTIVQDAIPVNVTPPAVTGTALRSFTLTGTPGTWAGLGNSFAYQWQSSTDGQTWNNLPGATTPAYTIGQSDEGTQLRLQVTASNADGTAAAQSQPTAMIPDSAPTNTAAPTITGVAQRGDPLTGTQGTWTGIGNSYAYQWQRSTDGSTWTNIAAQTGTSYLLAGADEGCNLRLLVTATNVDGTLTIASQPTATVLASPPTNSAAPSITGTVQRDSVLSAAQGTWGGIGNTYTYQWQRSTDGQTWTNIAAQTGTSYTLSVADEGSQIRFDVIAANSDATLSVASQPTAAVPAAAPVNTTAPTITGTAQRSDTLSATQGAWNGIDNTYAYQWQRSTDQGQTWTSITGQTAASDTLGVSDEGTLLRVQVTATNVDAPGGVTATSQPTGPVLSAAPSSTTAPSIAGTAQRGQTLTGTQGAWTGIGNTYADQWQRSADGAVWTSIPGATGQSYTLQVADEYDTVRLLVTASNPDAPRGVAAASTPTQTVPTAPPVLTTPPTVTGAAQRDQTLTAGQGTWTGIGNTYTEQWQHSPDGSTWTNISGATAATYTPGVADEGYEIRLHITASNPDAPGGVSATSTPTATIPAAPPVATGAPTVTGNAQRASVLTATEGTWTGIGNVYSDQWQHSIDGQTWTDVAGQTAATYTLGAADEGYEMRVLVTATNPDDTFAVTSAPTAAVTGAPPAFTTTPAVTGTAQRAQTLTGTPGSWTGIGNTYADQWQRSADGQTWTNVTGATSTTYTLTVGDEGCEMRLQVIATNPDGTLTATSAPTATVTGAPPVSTAAPTITGTAQRTFTLSGNQGAWSGVGNAYTDQWQRSTDGSTWTNIAGATALTYTPAVADEGSVIRLQVSAANADGTTSADSAPTQTIPASPPSNTAAPAITGSAKRTGVLALANAGTWTGPDNTYAYQWQRSADGTNWTVIAGATGQSYTLTTADEGSQVRMLVTASNPDAPAGISAASNATAAVASAPPINTTLPAITGAPQRGITLSASQGAWSGPDNTYAYQWQHSSDDSTWTTIAGQTASTYMLGTADEQTYVRVQVTATNPDAPAGVSALSVATSAVQAIPPQNTVPPSLSGAAHVGAALTANAGAWSPAGTTFAYQWQRSADGQTWTAIAGATGQSYTLAAADAGDQVRVNVTGADVDGSQSSASQATAPVTQPPQNLTAPSAPTGTLHDTDALTADHGIWDTSGASFTYAWQRCPATATTVTGACTPIGSNAVTYVLTGADIGSTIAVDVSATSSGGTSAPVSSALTAVVTGRPLINTVAPSISGTATVPATLAANPGTWSLPATAIAYAWQRCDADGASDCTQVSTGTQYTLSGADDNHTLVLYVTATSPGQSVTAHSPALSIQSQPRPQDTVAPTVSGTAQRTFTLSSSQGTWTNDPTLSTQWQRCDPNGQGCADIPGATSQNYTLTQADEGSEITAEVTATNSSGQTTASAAPTPAVLSDPPVALHPPAVTGVAYEDDVQIGIVTGSAAWQATPDTTYLTSWQQCDASGQNCTTIAGANGSLYTPTNADVGHTLVAVITATNTDAAVTSASNPTPIISDAAPRWKTLPLISADPGNAGDVLSITPGVWTGPAVSTDNVWMMRCTNTCVTDGTANATSYTITAADLGAILRVQETASNAGGSVSVWSARYVGPVVSAAAGSAVLNGAASVQVRNTTGRTLATAQLAASMTTQMRAATARRAATRVLTLRRAHGITGALQAWACPVPVGSAPPGQCTGRISVRRDAALTLPASPAGKLRIVVVRR